MKVGDLVELKESVLQSTADLDMQDRLGRKPRRAPRWLGVITNRHMDAIKVYWFNKGNTTKAPSTNQYTLKVKVISEL